jgi:tRNA(Ile)-lysidine synthase
MTSSPRSSPTRRRTSSKPWPGSGRAPAASERAPAHPLGPAEFAALIGALGPFERRPRLAVAVSGGPDSLGLCLLADQWARAQGGGVTALIVDHGLRPGAAAEARQVGAWLRARRIAHRILTWSGPKPATGIQEAARDARYALLGRWCQAQRVLHLLLAHHMDDQAETVALRMSRHSGPDGLAGMAAVRELPGLRLLRPLLSVPKARLRATLAVMGQPWLEDPSNLAPAFARSRLRLGAGLDSKRLAALAATYGTERAARDEQTAAWLARHARIDPAGFVLLAPLALATAPLEIARRVLQQTLISVGGSRYPPRLARLARLLEQVRGGLSSGRTLAGCRILPWREALLICREPRAIVEVMPLLAGAPVLWDNRFRVAIAGEVPGLLVRALAPTGARRLDAAFAPTAARFLPAPVRPGLPSVWRGEELVAVPHLGLVQPQLALAGLVARFEPASAVAGASFHTGRGPLRTTLLRCGECLC